MRFKLVSGKHFHTTEEKEYFETLGFSFNLDSGPPDDWTISSNPIINIDSLEDLVDLQRKVGHCLMLDAEWSVPAIVILNEDCIT